ncbi:MAG: hypothetical protein ISS45_02280 [Candidatus Omnitrophica bacterium]|nr:hypothetical protein [Candidatus Omnitrophota bacterium]
MRLFRDKKGQSALEYAALIGIIVAVILSLQMFVKRGAAGGIKSAADKLGQQFSANGTTIKEDRIMSSDQIIYSEVNSTGDEIGALLPGTEESEDVFAHGVHSWEERTGGKVTTEVKQKTEAAANETFRWDEYDTTEVVNFADPF